MLFCPKDEAFYAKSAKSGFIGFGKLYCGNEATLVGLYYEGSGNNHVILEAGCYHPDKLLPIESHDRGVIKLLGEKAFFEQQIVSCFVVSWRVSDFETDH